MSAPTVEDLRRQIAEEVAAHQASMAAIAEQRRKFESVLADDQQAFSDLITRVTNLRVAMGEQLASRSTAHTSDKHLSTGSALLDGILDAIQAKLEGTGAGADTSVLQHLENAALEAMTPYGPNRVSALFTSNPTAIRCTSVAVLFPNDVRGVRQWARRHVSGCATCAARQAQLPAWTPNRYDSKATGLAAAPNLRAIPNKTYHKVSCSLLQERSLAARMDREEQLDLMRGTFFLHVQGAAAAAAGGGGQPLADAAATCAHMTATLDTFVQSAMSELREAARTAAPWNVAGPSANAEMSAAVEILLHMVAPRVCVSAVNQPAVTKDGSACSLVQVDVAVSVPLQVSAVAPLLQVLRSAEQRRYVIEKVLTPLAESVGEALGVGGVASAYTSMTLKFVEGLYRLALRQGLISTEEGSHGGASSTAASAATASRSEVLSQLYLVLQALAVFGTTVEVELATPRLGLESAESSQAVKMAGLRLAQSLLLHFSAPAPLTVPPADDPAMADMTVKITRAPTTFLEILNRTFSSNHRLPSTARSSALDTFMSPKSKISLGLKLFREMVVEVYRPYHPTTGVVLAAENGVAGKPRAPPCVPVADLPVDCVAANVAVADYVGGKLAQLQQCAAAVQQAPAEAPVERAGMAVLRRVSERLRCTAAVEGLRAAWAAAQVRVVAVPKACVDVVVPFSMTEVDVREAKRPLLYLRVVYEC